MKYLKILFLCFFALNLQSQESQDNEMNDILQQAQWNSLNLTQISENGIDLHKAKAEGSSLLWDDWKPVDLELVGGKIIDQFDVNFDLDEEQAILQKDGKIYSIPGEYIEGFHRYVKDEEGNDFERRWTSKSYNGTKGIYELIESGNYCLYKHIDVSLIKANYNAALNVGSKNPKIKRNISFYIQHQGGNLIKILSKRKKAINEFSSNRQISNYLKKNKLNLKDQDDLKKMINYLNLKSKDQ